MRRKIMTKEMYEALYDKEFYDNVMDAFYSSEEFQEAFDSYLEDNWDNLVDEYRPSKDFVKSQSFTFTTENAKEMLSLLKEKKEAAISFKDNPYDIIMVTLEEDGSINWYNTSEHEGDIMTEEEFLNFPSLEGNRKETVIISF
jgi:hypothetical protein